MHHIEWSEQLRIGVKSIDDQHKELIGLCNELIDVIEQKMGEAAIEVILAKLREYTVFHFNSEEEYMSEIRYPDRGKHAEQHRHLKKQVKEYRRSIYLHEDVGAKEVSHFLKEWLLDHILVHDMDIARFVRQNKPPRD